MTRPPRVLLLLSIAVLVVVPASATEQPFDPGVPFLIDVVEQVLDEQRFVTVTGVEVHTTAETVFIELDGVADLGPGALVQVDGYWEGEIAIATSVELLRGAETPFAITGQIAILEPPVGFYLSDGTLAQVHDDTVYTNIAGYQALTVGANVRISGIFDNWLLTIRVDELELIDSGNTWFVGFEGVVAEVILPDRVVLADGSVLVVSTATSLESFSTLTDLVAGDRLWIEAYTTGEQDVYDAVSITRVTSIDGVMVLALTVATVEDANRFTTYEGFSVIVSPRTAWVGASGIDGLRREDRVSVEGTIGDDPFLVDASMVTLLPPGLEGEGLVSEIAGTVDLLLPPDAFVLDTSLTIHTGATTQWTGNLTAYEDLRAGMAVLVAAEWDAGGDLLAASVEGLGSGGASVILTGEVTDARPDEQLFRISTGDWISIRPEVPIDGDVNRLEEIAPGMNLTAQCVPSSVGSYLALWVLVEYVSLEDYPFSLPSFDSIDEALVILAENAVAGEVAERHGAELVGALPGSLVHLFRWPTSVDQALIELMLADADVDDVEPNLSAQDPETIRSRFIGIDRQPTSVKYNGQYAVNTVALSKAHERSVGNGTLVAVIDTGVDPFHPLLRHRIADGGWDYIDDDDSPWETADGIDQDQDSYVDEAAGHGTFVAGLVLLAAPGTKILPYRVLNDDGHGTTFAICQAVLAAMDRGADVINMSFAYDNKPRVLDRILDQAAQRGIVLVSGAGNSESTLLPFPAIDHRVIAVAATGPAGYVADFSNRGADVALAAPGVELYSGGAEGEFGTWSGTSMAAPLVSGAAALLRSVNPYLRPEEIEAALLQSAAEVAAGEPGLLQIDAALWLVPNATWTRYIDPKNRVRRSSD